MSERPDPFANDPWLAERPPSRRGVPKWLIFTGVGCGCAIALPIGIHLLIIAVAAMSYVSEPKAVPGDAVDSDDLEWLLENKMIEADERILYLCSDQIPSDDDIPPGFKACVLSDRRVTTCSLGTGGALSVQSASYLDLLAIDEAYEEASTRSVLRVETVDQREFYVCVDTTHDGDSDFESTLRAIWRQERARAIDGLRSDGGMNLHSQIEALSRFGIALPDEFTIDDLCTAHPREEYEDPPFELLFTFLADVERDWAGGGDVFLLDFDCIEDTGDYTRFAERVRDLANGALPIEEIADEVDLERRVAVLHFELEGRPQHWEAKFDGDMLDRSILSRFAALLAEGTKGTRFACAKLDGDETLLLVCIDRDRLVELRRQTGMDFEFFE